MVNNDKNGKQWPINLEEAVEIVLSRLSEEDKDTARNMSELEFLGKCWLSLGMYVRNQFGLWQGNQELKSALGASSPDDASRIILSAIWEALQEEADVSSKRS